MKTPLFVMSSMWDLYQLEQMTPLTILDRQKKTKKKNPMKRSQYQIHLPPTLKREVKYLESFANNSYRSVVRVSVLTVNLWHYSYIFDNVRFFLVLVYVQSVISFFVPSHNITVNNFPIYHFKFFFQCLVFPFLFLTRSNVQRLV